MAVARGEATDDTKDRFRIKYSSEEAEGEKAAAASTPSKQTWLQSVGAKLGRKDLVPHPLDEDNKVEAMVDKLDLTYRYVDDDEEQAHASEDVESGSSGRAGDNLFGPLSIEDYVRYRARPVCTYLERTAPWRFRAAVSRDSACLRHQLARRSFCWPGKCVCPLCHRHRCNRCCPEEFY